VGLILRKILKKVFFPKSLKNVRTPKFVWRKKILLIIFEIGVEKLLKKTI
jgi:hypothetical protein